MRFLEINKANAQITTLTVMLILVAGCRTPRPASPALDEVSVKPGINREFMKDDVQVTQWVERFEREGREIYDQRARITEAVALEPGDTVADIGTGTGLFVPLFAEAVGSSGRVYAVDIAQDFLTHIDERCAEPGLENVKTVLGTERSVELAPGSVDVAFICDTYHHFEYPESTMASIHQALKRKGKLVLIEFKRVPGESSDWILEHVRGGKAEFISEIEAAGFEKTDEQDFLKANYLVRFRKTPQ